MSIAPSPPLLILAPVSRLLPRNSADRSLHQCEYYRLWAQTALTTDALVPRTSASTHAKRRFPNLFMKNILPSPNNRNSTPSESLFL